MFNCDCIRAHLNNQLKLIGNLINYDANEWIFKLKTICKDTNRIEAKTNQKHNETKETKREKKRKRKVQVDVERQFKVKPANERNKC